MPDSIYDYDWENIYDQFVKTQDIRSDLICQSDEQTDVEVTIGIPAYRRVESLERAIESTLNQNTDIPYEILICDDAMEPIVPGRDEYMRSLCNSRPNVRYYRNSSNLGTAYNWNRLITLAKGEWITILHDDDILYESYVDITYKWACKCRPCVIGVFHNDCYPDSFDLKVDLKYGRGLSTKQRILENLRMGRPFEVRPEDIYDYVYPSPIAPMLNVDRTKQLGGFSGDYNEACDERFFSTAIFNEKVMILPKVLCGRGIDNNQSLAPETQKRALQSRYRFCRRMIDKSKTFKKLKRFRLDISETYMLESIKGHFNADTDFRGVIKECGVSDRIIGLPKPMLHFFKYVPLVSLVFRP